MTQTPEPPPAAPWMARLMRLFFRLLYHSFSWSYDLVSAAVSWGRWNDWVLASASLLQPGRVLELGFGPGHLQAHLQQAGWSATGLDESMQMARQAHRRLARKGQPARLIRGLAQRLPYPAGAFQNVIATFPTPYITAPATLAEVDRVLAPGGRLVVLLAAWITGDSPRDRLLRGLFRVTGQAPADDLPVAAFLDPYQRAGFQASARFVEMPGARLLLITAAKAKS